MLLLMNANADEILTELASFQAALNFLRAEPVPRAPSHARAATAVPLEAARDRCARDLASLVKSGASPALLSMCIKTSLCSVEKPFNKEAREYLAYYYDQLGNWVGVDMGPLLY